MQKRALAIHDISCVGRCSLTVALPVLSAVGIETSILPTAVLSTHTGGFTGYTFRDLTEDIMPIAEHWKSLDLRVDAIYTGYLGSFEQIEMVKKIIDMFRREDTVVLVDPVMGDNGSMYAGFGPEFAKGMVGLCQKADIVIPNLTEAALFLDEEYAGEERSKTEVEDMMRRLSQLCGCSVAITGVSTSGENLGAGTFDKDTGKVAYSMAGRVHEYYHGTGDVFGSSFLAAYMNGKNLEQSAQIAADFTRQGILNAIEDGQEPRYGADFERSIPWLIKAVKGEL